jgi:tellurite resistance protein TerC
MVFTLWIGFIALVIFLLVLDLGVFHKKDHVIFVKEALLWTGFWIVLALLFGIFIYYAYEDHFFGIAIDSQSINSGKDALLKYYTGYIIEKSLSLDNIFVIAIIFSYFGVPLQYQHRVLFYGILGALVFRAIMIIAGSALIQNFSWMIYVFGGVLIITAVKMLFSNHEKVDPEKNVLVKLARKIFPVSEKIEGHNFFTKINGKTAITPLFLVLVVDSIPAIFAVTTDPFIVFTSNVFAILGLRSLYFALAAMMNKFKYLKISLVFILAYVGVKMLMSNFYHIPTLISLGIIIAAISIGITVSLITAKDDKNLQ